MEFRGKSRKVIRQIASKKTLGDIMHSMVSFSNEQIGASPFSGSQFILRGQIQLESPSIIHETINYILNKVVDVSQQQHKVKKVIESELQSFSQIVQATLNIYHEAKSEGFGVYIDPEPITCGVNYFHTTDFDRRRVKSRTLSKRRNHQVDKQQKNDKPFPSALFLPDRNSPTNKLIMRRDSRFESNSTQGRNTSISLVSLGTNYQPQSADITKLRQERFCPLFDNFKRRKQKLKQKQKQNALNFRNMTYTFDYSSQKINVSQNTKPKPKMPYLNINAMIGSESGSKTKIQIQNLSGFEKAEIPFRIKKSIFVDNMIQAGTPVAQTNQSVVLKVLLDKIMGSNKSQKVSQVGRSDTRNRNK